MPKPASDVPNRQVTPLSELEKRTRRRFSTAEKLRILDEAGTPESRAVNFPTLTAAKARKLR